MEETPVVEEPHPQISTSDAAVAQPRQNPQPGTEEEDVGILNGLPPELPQMPGYSIKDDEEVPSSSVASVPKDDFSSLTSYSIFSKEQRRRRWLNVDREVPTNSQPDDIAIPAVVDLPLIQDLRPLPSLVAHCNVSMVPSKALVQPPFFGAWLPGWIRESPAWIKRTLLLCLFLLLVALLLILAVASRNGLLRSGSPSNETNPARTSIGLEDIPANTPTDKLVPTPSPTVATPLPWPYPISMQEEYLTYSPAQAAMQALSSPSPTVTRTNGQAHPTARPTLHPTLRPHTGSPTLPEELAEESDDIDSLVGFLPIPPTFPPTISMGMKSKMSTNKMGMMETTKQSMKGGMSDMKNISFGR